MQAAALKKTESNGRTSYSPPVRRRPSDPPARPPRGATRQISAGRTRDRALPVPGKSIHRARAEAATPAGSSGASRPAARPARPGQIAPRRQRWDHRARVYPRSPGHAAATLSFLGVPELNLGPVYFRL